MRRILKCLTTMAMFSGPLHAQDAPVQSRVYLESGSAGMRTVAEVSQLRRGDRVVTILDWRDAQGNSTMVSRVPAHLSFLDSSLDSLEVSTDGGHNWKALENSNGGQVTHLRWRAAPGRGRLAYSAIVR